MGNGGAFLTTDPRNGGVFDLQRRASQSSCGPVETVLSRSEIARRVAAYRAE
jgi:hypothetical protein